jgi:curved DNA-binding protein CbpA
MSFIRLDNPRHPLYSLSFEERCHAILYRNIDLQLLFGVADNFNLETLKKAYKHLALHFHPDKHQNSELAKITFQLLNNLYHQLNCSPKTETSSNSSTDVTYPFNFDWDEFYNTEGMPPDIAAKLNALKLSYDSFNHGSKMLEEFRQKIETPDFSKIDSAQKLNTMHQAFLQSIEQQFNYYLPKFQELDNKISYQAHDKKFVEKVEIWVNLLKNSITADVKLRSTQISLIEKFLFSPYTELDRHWKALMDKAEELETKAKCFSRYQAAGQTARQLKQSLEQARQEFLSSTGLIFDQEKFSKTCLDALTEAEPILAKHRGLAQLIADLSLNLLIFLSTLSLSFVITQKYRFFKPQTDSLVKMEALRKSL